MKNEDVAVGGDLSSHFRIPESKKIALMVGRLLQWAIPGVLIGGVIGGLIGRVLASMTGHQNRGGLEMVITFAVLGALALWLYVSYEQSLKTLHKAEKNYLGFASNLCSAVDRLDYWFALPTGAIGVDVKGRRLAIVVQGRKNRPSGGKVIPFEKLRGYRIEDVPPEVMKTFGWVGFGVKDDVKKHNAAEQQRSIEMTGLRIEFDDLEFPEAFIAMPKEYAKKWALVIDKVRNGSLETREKPLFYPAIEI